MKTKKCTNEDITVCWDCEDLEDCERFQKVFEGTCDDFFQFIHGTEDGAPDGCYLERVWYPGECPAFAKIIMPGCRPDEDYCKIFVDCYGPVFIPKDIKITPEMQAEAEKLGIVVRRNGCWYIQHWEDVQFF